MKSKSFTAALTVFSAYLGMAAGPCTPTRAVVCPGGTSNDGTGTGNCTTNAAGGTALAPQAPLGSVQSGFYYMGYDAGYTLGNGAMFTSIASTNTAIVADSAATFAAGPLPGSTIAPITESLNAVAVYTAKQAQGAGVVTYDSVTGSGFYPDGTSGGLTGYIVAVGYALSTSGDVVTLIVRYTPRGTLDTTFNGTGYVLGSPGGFAGGSFSMLQSVAIDGLGNIIVGGYTNTIPSISAATAHGSDFGLLSFLRTFDGDSFAVSKEYTGNSGETIGIVARYTPAGALDSHFDTTLQPCPTVNTLPDQCAASGWAVNGYATSPASGFYGGAPSGQRFDAVSGVAVDAYNGVYAVGRTGLNSVFLSVIGSSAAFISHYTYAGDMDTTIYENAFGALESYTAVTTDSAGNVIAAGQAGSNGGFSTGGQNFAPLVARFNLLNPGTPSEVLVRDTSFNSGGPHPGSLLATPVIGSSNVKAVAYDPAGYIVVVGEAGYASAASCSYILTVTDNTSASETVLSSRGALGVCPADYSGGSVESLHGVSVIRSVGHAGSLITRYVATGFSQSPAGYQRSLIASYQPSTLALDTTFSADPYLDGRAAGVTYTNALPPFSGGPSPIAQSSAAFPPFDNSSPGYQVGPDNAFTYLRRAYGGGSAEVFNSVVPSADGQSAVVVGFTSDFAGASNSTTATLTGRSFPILLTYGRSVTTNASNVDSLNVSDTFGVFTNYGESQLFSYDNFYFLQMSL